MKQRGEEEIGDALSARTNNALLIFHEFLDADGMEIRTHSTDLHNYIYLTERQIIVNHHVYGLPTAKSPVGEGDRTTPPEMAGTYAQNFESAWITSHHLAS